MEIGLFDVALRNSQDFDHWSRLARHGTRLSYQRQVLLKYRCRPDGLTGDTGNCLRRELRMFDKVEQSYDLTPTERVEVAAVIRDRRALLEFEMGKDHLVQGQFSLASDSFARAHEQRPSMKKLAALWLSRLAPGLMRTICLRRM